MAALTWKSMDTPNFYFLFVARQCRLAYKDWEVHCNASKLKKYSENSFSPNIELQGLVTPATICLLCLHAQFENGNFHFPQCVHPIV